MERLHAAIEKARRQRQSAPSEPLAAVRAGLPGLRDVDQGLGGAGSRWIFQRHRFAKAGLLPMMGGKTPVPMICCAPGFCSRPKRTTGGAWRWYRPIANAGRPPRLPTLPSALVGRKICALWRWILICAASGLQRHWANNAAIPWPTFWNAGWILQAMGCGMGPMWPLG